jgi:hypothetical protein
MRGELSFAEVVERNRAYFSAEIIKEPMMTFFVDQVRARFPHARYVFVVRDPRDNIRSQLNRKSIPGHLPEIEPRYIPRCPPYNTMVDPTVWGGKGENYVGVLAHRWNRAVDAYLQCAKHMELAKYEDFCADKQRYILALARHLGVEAQRDISDRVDIQYQPAGDHKTSWEEFFGPNNLSRITKVCAGRMSAMGYQTSSKPTVPGPGRPEIATMKNPTYE